MNINRRRFVTASAALGAAPWLGCGASESGAAGVSPPAAKASIATAREAFPWSQKQTYLNNAGSHPTGLHAIRAAERYLAYTLDGPGGAAAPFGDSELDQVRESYARLIGAKASEIAFVQSTLVGENLVAAGLGLHDGKGNVVIDELHYHGGSYIYRRLQERGLDLRILPQHDWKALPEDYEKAIDGDTRLVAITLVSNINGFLYDAKAISDIAHSHGAYVYADIIQAAGCVPVDVAALGIDFSCASTFKWLMGLRGLGLFHAKESLQGDVLKVMAYGDRQYSDFEYHRFPGSPAGDSDVSYESYETARRYEIGSLSEVAAATLDESLAYIHALGVDKILEHAKPLCARLLEELPKRGYPAITPPNTPTPIAAFLAENPKETQARLTKANVAAKVKWNQLRVSPSVFNTEQDIDKLIEALS